MLTVGDGDIARWLGEFFWPFLRILALLAACPGFNSPAIPPRAKVALAFAVTLPVAAAIRQTAPLELSWTAAVLAVQQVMVGLAIGFAMQLTLTAMALAGEFVGLQMGFGIATLFDIQSGVPVPVIANFFSLTGLLLFLGMDGHLVMLGAVVKSFDIVPIAVNSGIAAAGWHALARAGVLLLQLGVWLALPVIAVLLAAHLAVAVVSRVAPQFNVMSIGFSLFIWIGLAGLVAIVPFFVPAVAHMVEAGLAVADAVLRSR